MYKLNKRTKRTNTQQQPPHKMFTSRTLCIFSSHTSPHILSLNYQYNEGHKLLNSFPICIIKPLLCCVTSLTGTCIGKLLFRMVVLQQLLKSLVLQICPREKLPVKNQTRRQIRIKYEVTVNKMFRLN